MLVKTDTLVFIMLQVHSAWMTSRCTVSSPVRTTVGQLVSVLDGHSASTSPLNQVFSGA